MFECQSQLYFLLRGFLGVPTVLQDVVLTPLFPICLIAPATQGLLGWYGAAVYVAKHPLAYMAFTEHGNYAQERNGGVHQPSGFRPKAHIVVYCRRRHVSFLSLYWACNDVLQ